MGLRLVHDPALFRWTLFTLCALALLVALAASALLRRSPGWTLRNRTLILGAAAIAGLAVVSTSAAGSRLPVLSPAGSMDLPVDFSEQACIGASRSMVALAKGDWLRFVDFADPAHPRMAAETRIPLWDTHTLVFSGSQAYILGTRKALPSDEVQVAIASPAPGGSVQLGEPISLGTSGRSWFPVSIAVAGHFLYLDAVRGNQLRLEAYDLSPGASGRPAGAVVVGRTRPLVLDSNNLNFADGIMRMRIEGQFLYATTPEALTAIDIRDPGRPLISSQIPYRDPVGMMYHPSRDLASDGRWLLEAEPLVGIWNLYDLADPAHPVLRGHAPKRGYGLVSGTGPDLFENWREGALEFRSAGSGLQALRYLNDGRDGAPDLMTAADGYVYMLKRVKERRYVSAFRVTR
jgi:hypothetical protein